MTEYEIKLIRDLLEDNSNKIADAIKGCTFNLARIYNKMEEIEVLLRNQQKQESQIKEKSGIIR